MPVFFYLVRADLRSAAPDISRFISPPKLTACVLPRRRPRQDPEFATDPRCAPIRTLTLSYTFFRVDGAPEHAQAAQAALAAQAAHDVAAAADAEDAAVATAGAGAGLAAGAAPQAAAAAA
jgi:hypothetical protein